MKTTQAVATLAATLITIVSLTGRVNAALTITWSQVGADVVAVSSGSLSEPASFDYEALNYGPSSYVYGAGAYIGERPDQSDIWNGTDVGSFVATYSTASSSTGLYVGLGVAVNGAVVDATYVYGSELSSSSTWLSTTLAALGLSAADDYRQITYSTASGGTDTLTLRVAAVPEPNSVAFMGLAGLCVVVRRHRRA